MSDIDVDAQSRMAQINRASQDAEEALLSACLLDNDIAAEVAASLDEADFNRPRYRAIFKAVAEIADAGEDVNQLSVAEKLQKDGELERVGGRATLIEICSNMLALSGWREQMREVRRSAMARKLVYAAARITGLACDAPQEPAELADIAAAILDEACATRSASSASALDAYRASVASEMHNVVECGFAELDEVGFCRRGALTVLGGATGVGKTAFCIESAFLAAAAYGTRCAVVSLEDDMAGVGARLAQVAADARRDPEDMLEGLPVSIVTGDSLTPQQALSRLNRVKRSQGLDLVFIDSLQCVAVASDMCFEGQAWRGQVEVARQLRTMARKLGAAVVVTSQLTRTAQKRGGGYGMIDLRDSGSIEQDAAVVAMLEPCRKVRICKNRNGACECIGI